MRLDPSRIIGVDHFHLSTIISPDTIMTVDPMDHMNTLGSFAMVVLMDLETKVLMSGTAGRSHPELAKQAASSLPSGAEKVPEQKTVQDSADSMCLHSQN